MKKLALALLALIALCTTSCGDKASETEKAPSGTQQGEAFASISNIRYIDEDSIRAHYQLSKETDEEAKKLFLELQQLQASLGQQLQSYENQINQKLNNNGYLSEESYKADLKEYSSKQYQAQETYGKREAAVNQTMAEKQKVLLDSINNFIIDFNKERKYDAILYKNAGLYFNPALDITAEVIEGLNKRYKPAAKTEEKKEDNKTAAK